MHCSMHRYIDSGPTANKFFLTGFQTASLIIGKKSIKVNPP